MKKVLYEGNYWHYRLQDATWLCEEPGIISIVPDLVVPEVVKYVFCLLNNLSPQEIGYTPTGLIGSKES